jgi:hypothetical protein
LNVTVDDRQDARVVFEAALRRDPEERDAFVDEACAATPELRADVELLLADHDLLNPQDSRASRPGTSVGRVIGPYIIRGEIGRGGMGIVYLADDTRLSRRVALKALAPDVSRETGLRDRLRLEARAVAALTHPGIATVYALEEIGGDLYLACEYVPGPTIRALLEKGPLSLADSIDVAIGIASALSAAHDLNIVHRDLKPENVVRMPTGAVKVLDFGIARMPDLTTKRLTQTGTIIGTPAYMAPEQVLAGEIDFRTDQFALGILLYEMVSGSNPFEAESLPATGARIVNFEPPVLSEVCPSSSSTLDRLVATCLNKQALGRFRSTHEIVAALEGLRGTGSPRRTPAPIGGRAAKSATPPSEQRLTTRRWWMFHQAAVSAVYALILYPVWRAHVWLPSPWGMLFFFAVLACVAGATALRLHLWFTAHFYPGEFAQQRTRTLKWMQAGDVGLAISLLAGALGIGDAHLGVGTLLVAVSIAATVASFVIEPTTTRAAFGRRSGAYRAPSKQRRGGVDRGM